jgi:hypothetical protein
MTVSRHTVYLTERPLPPLIPPLNHRQHCIPPRDDPLLPVLQPLEAESARNANELESPADDAPDTGMGYICHNPLYLVNQNTLDRSSTNSLAFQAFRRRAGVDPHLKTRGIEVPLASRPSIRRTPVRRDSGHGSRAPLRAVPEDTPWVVPSREEPIAVEVEGYEEPQLNTRGDAHPPTSAAPATANRSRRHDGSRTLNTDRYYGQQIPEGRSIAGGSGQPRSKPDTATVEAAPVSAMEREATIIPPPTLANSEIAVPKLSVPEIAAPDAAEPVRFPVGGPTSANSTHGKGSRGTTSRPYVHGIRSLTPALNSAYPPLVPQPQPYVYGSLSPTPALNAAYPPLVPQHLMPPPPYSEAIESLTTWLDDDATLKGLQGTHDFSRRFLEKISTTPNDLIDWSSPLSSQDAHPPAPGMPPSSDPQRRADEALSDHLRDLLTLVYAPDVKQRVSNTNTNTNTRDDADDGSSKTETFGDKDFRGFASSPAPLPPPSPPTPWEFDESTTRSLYLSAWDRNSDPLPQPVQARPGFRVVNFGDDDDLYN